jgi:hypothetical protein
MTPPSLRTPLSIIAAAVLLIGLMLTRPAGSDLAFSQGYTIPTNTPAATNTPAPTSTPAATSAPGATSAPRVTSQPTQAAAPAPIQQPTAAPLPTNRPTPTATQATAVQAVPTASAPSNALTCQPGVPVTLVGNAPARAPLLIFFNGRIVGGGSAEPSGAFALALSVGSERAGVYPVEVRVRGSWEAVATLTCTVPATAAP